VTSLSRAALGGDVDPRVRPVVAVSFAYAVSFSTFWVYVGVFAVDRLGARAAEVGILFLLSAPAAGIANYLSGSLSDLFGRKRPIVASFLAAAATVGVLAAVGRHTVVGFAMIVLLGVVGAPAYSLDRVLVADLLPDGYERESAFATVRVASNLGVFVGPPLGALLLHVGGWTAFLTGVVALGLGGAVVSVAFLPETGTPPRERTGRGALGAVVGDSAFVLLLVSTLLGFAVYVGYETVLPVIAISDYAIDPATWGLLVAISPLLVIVAQLRLTRATAHIAPGRRLVLALLLMGLPFLALTVSSRLIVIAGAIVVFVVGEMIWMPTSQALAARLAPPESRGAYFGALAATTGPAWTLAPFVAFQLRAVEGVAAVWVLFAGLALVAALVGARAAPTEPAGARAGRGRP
jgi:predicted MFS family arabinose efflux permease